MIEFFNAFLLIYLNKLIPKHKINNRILIFAEMGIGDLIMFLPTIRAIVKNGYQVSFYVTRITQKQIIQFHFPECQLVVEGKFGISFNNFHCCLKRKYILTIMRLRIPVRIGHAIGKWKRFFNYPIDFNFENYQPDENIRMLKPLGILNCDIPLYDPDLYFNIEPSGYTRLAHLGEYYLIAPFSSNNNKKEYPYYFELSQNIKITIFILGCHDDEENILLLANSINKSDVYGFHQLSIFEAAYLIKHSQHFYCNEGGLQHIAAAVGARTTVFYRKGISREHALHRRLKYMEYIEFD